MSCGLQDQRLVPLYGPLWFRNDFSFLRLVYYVIFKMSIMQFVFNCFVLNM